MRGSRSATAVFAFLPQKTYFTVISPYGEPDPPAGTYEYYECDTVNANCGPTPCEPIHPMIYPWAGTRFICTGHSGTGNITDGPETSISFVITMDSSVTWLWQTQYELTVDSLYGDPQGEGWYNAGETANWSITSPWPDMEIRYETGIRYVTSPTSGAVFMDAPKIVTVLWDTQFLLETDTSPPWSGVEGCGCVERSPEGEPDERIWPAIMMSYEASWYYSGTPVLLTATGSSGYVFTNWSGDLSGTDNPATLIMDGHKSVIANFAVASWAKTYSGAADDSAYSIQQTSDGGYIVAGYTESFSAGYYGDFWVLKLNSDGSVSWQKTYGGANFDRVYSIQQTSDGGYIVAGHTESFGAGTYDFWVLKLNSDGTVAWQKAYGGATHDIPCSIQQTIDGGYIVAGETSSFGAGPYDFWVLKLNSDGTVAWQKRYGGADSDWASSIQQTSDGGYIVAGYTFSFGAGDWDFWVLKLNSDGTVAWQKRYGGANRDWAYSIQQTTDGGYIVAGYTESFGASGWDFWVLKLNSDGTVAWQKAYSGAGDEQANSIRQTTDGGYIVAGGTSSFGASSADFWILKLNSDGTASWQKRYGGANYDYAYSIQQASDGGYIVAGETYSFGVGYYPDFWLLKLNSDGTIAFNPASGAQMADTNAVPVDTSATVADTTATVTNTSATVTDTNATVVDTDATIEQQAP